MEECSIAATALRRAGYRAYFPAEGRATVEGGVTGGGAGQSACVPYLSWEVQYSNLPVLSARTWQVLASWLPARLRRCAQSSVLLRQGSTALSTVANPDDRQTSRLMILSTLCTML